MTMGFNNQNLFYYETNLFDYDKACDQNFTIWMRQTVNLFLIMGLRWFGLVLKLLWQFHQDLDCLGCFREDFELVWIGLVWSDLGQCTSEGSVTVSLDQICFCWF